ncbi:hypothetical protein M0802_000496 [Mischocyttarus mexicanus]|nr:hypothetical protein M0802_000496 [Mischocyttarus mexicanus]
MKVSSKHLTKKLIEEIKNKRIIWDPSSENYKKKNERKKAWQEVCSALSENFEDLPVEMKDKIVKQAKLEWMLLEDMYYMENRGDQSNAIEREAGLSPFEKQLDFLKTVPFTLNNWERLNLECQDFSLPILKEDFFLNKPPASISKEQKKLSPSTHEAKSSKEMSDSKTSSEDYLSMKTESLHIDEDMAFFNSVNSSLKKLDHEDILLFRIQAMQCLQNLLERNSARKKQNSNAELSSEIH